MGKTGAASGTKKHAGGVGGGVGYALERMEPGRRERVL